MLSYHCFVFRQKFLQINCARFYIKITLLFYNEFFINFPEKIPLVQDNVIVEIQCCFLHRRGRGVISARYLQPIAKLQRMGL